MNDASAPSRHRLSVDDYHKLGEAGILNEDSRVELIDGELIDMAPVGGQHVGIVNRLNKLFVLALGDEATVSVRNPVTLPPHSEPQPDVTIVRSKGALAPLAVPTPADILLLIEVADTTLRYDRGTKLPLYARAGIPEVWIVDVQGSGIEMHRDPSGSVYGYAGRAGTGHQLSPLNLPHIRLAVDDILG